MVNSSKRHVNSTKVLSCLCGLLTLSFLISTAYHPYVASAMMLKATKKPIASTKNSTVKSPPTGYASHFRHATDPHFVSSTTNATAYNWAGYASLDKSGTYHQAIGTFTVPTITGAPDPNRMVALWVGVGGGATNINASLIQAGVDSLLMPPDQSSSKPYQLNIGWYQNVHWNCGKLLTALDNYAIILL